MSIHDQFKQINSLLSIHAEALENAENALNVGVSEAMRQAKPEEVAKLQMTQYKIQNMLSKAKKGENVDKEINEISKHF